jgi:steroid delta-isomerase-like uncharacterized protein
MPDADAMALARRHAEEIVNGRQLELVDQLYAPDAVFHDPVAPGGAARGRAEIKGFFAALVAGMPDFSFTIEDCFGTADRGVWRGTVSATLTGQFGPFPATGKSGSVPITEIFRVADGQIQEVWVYLDTLGMLAQLGVVSPPGA